MQKSLLYLFDLPLFFTEALFSPFVKTEYYTEFEDLVTHPY
jgi:hypothetical protein